MDINFLNIYIYTFHEKIVVKVRIFENIFIFYFCKNIFFFFEFCKIVYKFFLKKSLF